MSEAANGALGVIGGTGFYDFENLEGLINPVSQRVSTTYGEAAITTAVWHGRPTVFSSRHGIAHSVPPHMVNYRANIAAMSSCGVTEILGINVVGGIGHEAGELVVVDDFLDFTKGRVLSFFDGTGPEGVVHVDATEPYDPKIRAAWLTAATTCGISVCPSGIYACFEGPRFETRAEIRLAAAAGATVVGMTGVPEVMLARELQISYAALCLVANPAAGMGPGGITMEDINTVVAEGARTVKTILAEAARILSDVS